MNVSSSPAGAATPRVLTMRVERSASYDIRHVERYVFDANENALAELIGARKAMFCIDEVVYASHGAALEAYAATRLEGASVMTLSGSEAHKTLETVERVCRAANERTMPRDGVFVAVGGGVILDLVGFAASMYRRGVPYARVPTTLIGMIDVGVGIKQGVNFGGKNRLGSFYPSIGTINDARFLASLPHRYLSSGMAEILKMAIVSEPILFDLVERYGAELVATGFSHPPQIADDVMIRAEVAMMRDLGPNLFEQDLRRFVDFGHTFSPIFETETEYTLNHGEAVALDMLVSTSLAIGRGLCHEQLLSRLVAVFRAVALPLGHPVVTPDTIIRSVSEARANRAGALNLVLPTMAGDAMFVQDVDREEVVNALARIASAVSGGASD